MNILKVGPLAAALVRARVPDHRARWLAVWRAAWRRARPICSAPAGDRNAFQCILLLLGAYHTRRRHGAVLSCFGAPVFCCFSDWNHGAARPRRGTSGLFAVAIAENHPLL